MKAFFGIVIHTVRTAVRSRVFHLLMGLLILAVIVLPLTVKGDGTARSQVQIILTYSLSSVAVVLSLSSLWLACSMLSREIETYTAHMILTKPVHRATMIGGKAVGVFLLHGLLLAVGAACVFFLVQWRVTRGDFAPSELRELRKQVLVGRRLRRPPPPDFIDIARKEYQRRLREGRIPADTTPNEAKLELLRQVKAAYTEIPFGQQRRWVYDDIRVGDDSQSIQVRYRLYVGAANSSDQRHTQGVWSFLVPGADEPALQSLPVRAMGGAFNDLSLPAEAVSDDGRVELFFLNQDPGEESLIFQVEDRPTLLTQAIGFPRNALRSVLLLLLQLAFLSVLGTVVSALFSTPVAVFAGLSYLAIGMTADVAVRRAAQSASIVRQASFKTRVEQSLARTVRFAVASPREFSVAGELSRGHIIEYGRIGTVLLTVVVFQGGLLLCIGTAAFQRRELGKVVRR